MKYVHIVSVLVVSLLLFGACQSSMPAVEGSGDAAEAADTNRVYSNEIRVLVGGRDAGTLPQTVRIRRSFNTRQVSLYQRGEEIRVYEIPIQPTVAGDQTRMGFWGRNTMEGETYDVRNLPHEDGVYEIPFSTRPMKIEDNEYGLTLLIRE